MNAFCTMLLTHADNSHFHEAAFIRTYKLRMSFNAANHDNAVGFRSIFIDKYRPSIISNANLLRFHRCFDRTSHGFFRNTIPINDFKLTFRSCTAMTAHSRKYKGASAFLFYIVNNSFNDDINVRNTAAAAGNGNRHSRFDLRCYDIPI